MFRDMVRFVNQVFEAKGDLQKLVATLDKTLLRVHSDCFVVGCGQLAGGKLVAVVMSFVPSSF